MDTNTVITNWKKGTTEFECINPNGVSTVLGTSSEAEGKIASPKAIMLGSLAVCSGLDVIAILKKMRVELDDFKINTTARLTRMKFKSLSAEERFKNFRRLKLNDEILEKVCSFYSRFVIFCCNGIFFCCYL